MKKTIGLKNYTGFIDDKVVAFEHNLRGEDDGVVMHLDDNFNVTDYEGCYEIPAEVVAFMIKKGYGLRDVV